LADDKILLHSKVQRNPADDSIIIQLKSDLLEDWVKSLTVVNKGTDDERYDFTKEVCGVKAYTHTRLDRLMGDYINRRGAGFGDFTASYEYGMQLLKCVGLGEGVTIVIPKAVQGHDWTQAHIDAFHDLIRDCAQKIYTRYLLPTDGELTLIVRQTTVEIDTVNR
jgi:hypothetical protein